MKGRDIINHAVRAKMPDREQVKASILLAATEKETTKRPPAYRRYAVALSIVAVLVVCIAFVIMLMNPQQGNNIFSISAYAMEQQADGSVALHEVDIRANNAWSGFSDGVVTYLNIGLTFEGENIESVKFVANDGFFAKQHIPDGTAGDVPIIVGGDGAIQLYGTDFERYGGDVVLDQEAIAGNMLLFLGFDSEIPHTVTIGAIATFNDGTTYEETVVIVLRGRLGAMIVSNPDSVACSHDEAWRNISLEDCELILESVRLIGEADDMGVVYEFEIAPNRAPIIIVEQEIRSLEFDDDGIYRSGWGVDPDGWAYISVVKRNESGAMTGMVYRVPPEVVRALRQNQT